jgi:hypothetical protein
MIRAIRWMILLAATSGLAAEPEGPNPEGGHAQGERFHYLSRRRADGTWTEPVSLGEPVNTRRIERFPIVSPEGRYLFFTRWVSDDNEDVFWVSTAGIRALRSTTSTSPEKLK